MFISKYRMIDDYYKEALRTDLIQEDGREAP